LRRIRYSRRSREGRVASRFTHARTRARDPTARPDRGISSRKLAAVRARSLGEAVTSRRITAPPRVLLLAESRGIRFFLVLRESSIDDVARERIARSGEKIELVRGEIGWPEFRGAIWREMRGRLLAGSPAYFALQITIRRPREILKVDRAVARATRVDPFTARIRAGRVSAANASNPRGSASAVQDRSVCAGRLRDITCHSARTRRELKANRRRSIVPSPCTA